MNVLDFQWRVIFFVSVITSKNASILKFEDKIRKLDSVGISG